MRKNVYFCNVKLNEGIMMEATMVFDYDPTNTMAQKVLAFIRSLGIFHERSLDLEEAIRDVKTNNVEDYDNVDDFFKQHNLL